MSELARINEPRAATIVTMLERIERSANSQRAHPGEVAELMAPVVAQLRAMAVLSGPQDVQEPGPAPQASGRNQWADAVQMARTCDLQAGAAAMGVLATRIEQMIFEGCEK